MAEAKSKVSGDLGKCPKCSIRWTRIHAGIRASHSPDRRNPLGLHRVTVREIVDGRIRIGPMEAINGAPIADIKPVVPKSTDS